MMKWWLFWFVSMHSLRTSCNPPSLLLVGGIWVNDTEKMAWSPLVGMNAVFKASKGENLISHFSLLNLFTVGGKGFSSKGGDARKSSTLRKVELLFFDMRYWILLFFGKGKIINTELPLCYLLAVISKGNAVVSSELKLYHTLIWRFPSSV